MPRPKPKKKPKHRLPYALTDLKGRQVGNLKVLGRVRVAPGTRTRWRCLCTCGTRITVGHNRLIGKSPKTCCGCTRRGNPALYPREYHAWWDAKSRCHVTSHPSYPSYGAKGVRMCRAWRDSFDTFLRDMGTRPSSNHSLDRIDAKGNYESSNTRWATSKVQGRNKRDTKWVEHPTTGIQIKAADLAEELGVRYQVMRSMMIEKGLW